MSAATDEVIKLERRFWHEANKPEFFRHVFAEDGMTVFEPTGVITKTAALDMSAQSKPWTDVEMADIEARELAPNCVALTYRGSGRREGEAQPYRARISSVYVHRQGRWQLGFTQHQPLGAEAKT